MMRTQTREEAHADTIVHARTEAGALRTEVKVRGHTLVSDEPISLGGADEGPTPRNLMAAALAACTTMTLRMYADRKEWPLEAVSASVTHLKQKPADTDAGAGAHLRTDLFRIEVALEGPLDEAQRARLMEIAERCPVHRTLMAGADIITEAAAA